MPSNAFPVVPTRILHLLTAAPLLGFPCAAFGGTETILYSFQGGADGANPTGNLITDKAGNLYGTTTGGDNEGGGVVFQLSPSLTESLIYSFETTAAGQNPNCGLLRSANGTLFGTTYYGGSAQHYGVVFAVSPSGKETVLHSFTSGSDGAFPRAGLVRDKSGNLYGTTEEGGTYNYGTVFKVTSGGVETVIHTFSGYANNVPDGAMPKGGLLLGANGNLFGTTMAGGLAGGGGGSVFELSPAGTETILYSFSYLGANGSGPTSNVIQDKSGNFYGTTSAGGTYGYGTVFKLSPSGALTVLHSFSGSPDGRTPYAGVVEDGKGNLFGVTYVGGSADSGAVFEISATGVESIVYSFSGGTDGLWPYGGLIIGPKKELYGMTSEGGAYVRGTIFRVKP